jgi:hypothetical protein
MAVLHRIFADVPDDDVERMTSLNTFDELYGIDATKLTAAPVS